MASAPKIAPEQTTPISTETLHDPVLEVVSELIADLGARISAEVMRAKRAHAARFEEALLAVRESVKRELSESLRQEFEARFHESMEIAKQQFSERLKEVTARLERDGSQPDVEFTAVRQRAEVSAELIAKQSELEHLNRETQAMLDDPEVELSKIMRHNLLVAEVTAYIRGLQYLSGDLREDESQGVD